MKIKLKETPCRLPFEANAVTKAGELIRVGTKANQKSAGGNLYGVVVADVAQNETGTLDMQGVFLLPKTGSAIAVGDKLKASLSNSVVVVEKATGSDVWFAKAFSSTTGTGAGNVQVIVTPTGGV